MSSKPKDQTVTPLLLSAQQVAYALSVSRSQIWALRRAGVLEAVHVGGATRFRRCDIERIAREGT